VNDKKDEPTDAEADLLHSFRNQVGVIVGYSELMARELAGGDLLCQETLDLLRQDICQMQGAGRAALALIRKLSSRPKPKSKRHRMHATRMCTGE
jgi:hypothetical protein